MKYNKIALIGMMGSGKTTIGKLLAEKLKKDFIDSDEIFTSKFGEIKDYFANFGEQSFRLKEEEILLEASKKDNFILSTGGGIILSKKNRAVLFNSDIYTIYLKTSPDEILKRVESDNSRPLLKSQNKLKTIFDILQGREKYYLMAHKTIITDGITPENTANKITEEIKYGRN